MSHFLQRMLLVDSKYGEQDHQRRFLARYNARQEKSACPEDHEHENACYAKDGRDGSFNSWGV